MKKAFIDIVRHVGNISFFEDVRVRGTEDSTEFFSQSPDHDAYLYGYLNEAVPEFEGDWGIRDLNLLGNFIGFKSFKTDESKIQIKRRQKGEVSYPNEVRFISETGTKANFFFVNHEAVSDAKKLGKNIQWDITFSPTSSKVQEFSQLNSMLSDIRKTFTFEMNENDNELILNLGDPNDGNYSSSLVFAEDVVGVVENDQFWDTSRFLDILKLGVNDKEMSVMINNKVGILGLELKSSTGVWSYYINRNV